MEDLPTARIRVNGATLGDQGLVNAVRLKAWEEHKDFSDVVREALRMRLDRPHEPRREPMPPPLPSQRMGVTATTDDDQGLVDAIGVRAWEDHKAFSVVVLEAFRMRLGDWYEPRRDVASPR